MFELSLLALLITASAQIYINIKYKKYQKIKTRNNMSGLEVAQTILKENNLDNIYVVETPNFLGDHYDPKNKVIRLSKEVFHSETITAVAVAAHEASHAVQDKEGYAFLRFRNMLVPFVNFSSNLGYFVILIGFITGLSRMLYLGIGLIAVILIFQLITLPVEINASKQALESLKKYNILEEQETKQAKSVLVAAALTYVASVLASVLEILRLLLLANDRD